MKNEVGGYFGLELEEKNPYHKNCYEFNSARSSLSSLLHALNPCGIFLPALNCPDVASHIIRHHKNIAIEFYHVDENLDILNDIDWSRKEYIFYYVNIFGLKNKVSAHSPDGTIIDNVHAFFTLPQPRHHVIYSARKFFGVPDGAYLSTRNKIDMECPRYEAWPHAVHLLKRLDRTAQAGYRDFRESEEAISTSEIRQMSLLSSKILKSLNYERIAATRLRNFRYVHEHLENKNSFSPVINAALNDDTFVPFTYPYLIGYGERLRNLLVEKCIFTPKLWTFTGYEGELSDNEKNISENTVHLPIDQRYNTSDMDAMLKFILHE